PRPAGTRGGPGGTAGTARGSSLASRDEDSDSFLDVTDTTKEQVARLERRLERRRLVLRQRHEQAARGLRVVAERVERRWNRVRRDVRRGEVAVARVAARPHARAREG